MLFYLSPFTKSRGLILLIGILIASAPIATADDSAASVAVGGIQLKREARISMEKEVLTISETKVTVDYEFLNESDRDITTEVAFPIPRYDLGSNDPGGPRNFDDFRLWVNRMPVQYKTQIRAELNGKDYSELLESLGIDVDRFGGWDVDQNGNEVGAITKLPADARRKLASLGLIQSDGTVVGSSTMPQWSDSKLYYWRQTFPAHITVRIRHEYSPRLGFEEFSPDVFDPSTREKALSSLPYKNLSEACIDPSLQDSLRREALKHFKSVEDVINMSWVDFVLTTANSWKTPIKDFTLIVDRSTAPPYMPSPQYVSLCWDGSIRKIGPTRFEAHAVDFVPRKELHIAFFAVQKSP